MATARVSPLPARGQCFAQTGPVTVGPGHTLIDVDPLTVDAERGECGELRGEVLLVGGDPSVADQ